jgi:hypothetical protein
MVDREQLHQGSATRHDVRGQPWYLICELFTMRDRQKAPEKLLA